VITIKVTFEDGNSVMTGINASLEEATQYYLNQKFIFDESKPAVKAISVELL
jgi:hypothetical protein